MAKTGAKSSEFGGEGFKREIIHNLVKWVNLSECEREAKRNSRFSST